MSIVRDSNGNAVTDGSGNPVRSGGFNSRSSATNASINRNSTAPAQSVENFLGSALKAGQNAASNIANGVVSQAAQRVENFVQSTGFGKALRALNILPDAIPTEISFSDANWGSSSFGGDWRVRLSLPSNFNGPVLAPLKQTNGLVWPYTPQIYITHSAGYSPIKPLHSNYPFYAYQNSQVDQFAVVGDFYVENAVEGEYWIAAIHYLRSVTKMAYGQTSNVGSPPPVVRLNGYGDYVFKDVPVVVTQFAVELGTDVDYIKVDGFGPNGTWVPTRSNIQATLIPIYSRRAVESFSLDKFVNGGYIGGGSGFI